MPNETGSCVGSHGDEPPAAEVGWLCVQCFSRLRSLLLEMPALASWLHVFQAAGGTAIGERVTGSSEDPIPLRVDVLDLIGPVAPNPTAALTRDDEDRLTKEALDQAGEPSIFDELRSWATLVDEETGYEWADRQTLTGAVTYLATHLSWIAAQPWVDEFAAKLKHLERSAHRLAPWRAVTMFDEHPCESCNVRAVVLHVADSLLKCEKRLGGCGKVTVSDYLKQARPA